MYNGYRVKINGQIIQNSDMAKGSFKATKKRRVLASYHDATGCLHEVLSPHETITINFTLREMSMKEYESIRAAFEKRNNADVMYWDDAAGEYKQGKFKVQEFTVSHENALSKTIRYKETPIALEEY